MRWMTVTVAAVLLLSGCQSAESAPPATPPSPPSAAPSAEQSAEATTSPSPTPTLSAEPRPGSTPPPWLGTRVLPEGADGFGEVRRTPPSLRTRRFTLPDRLPPLPGAGFAARVDPVPDRVLARSTWQPACPVSRAELRWVRLTFRGFDGDRHTGELLVNARVADDLVSVFEDLWQADFPFEELRIASQADLDAPPTGDGNGTGAFNCRPVTGGSSYSQHAYGLAIDLDPFQNPYARGDVVLPELASAYLDRSRRAPGMIHPDGPVVRAFTRIGWGWGGTWTSLKDYQHFSESGR